MTPRVASEAAEQRVTGTVRVTGSGRAKKYVAQWSDRDGVRRTRTLGAAHVRDSGAVIWRAGDGSCPPGMVTPKAAAEQLSALLEAARRAPRKVRVVETEAERVPTFGDLVELWFAYLEKEKRRKASTVQDARNVANGYLLPHFGEDTPLYASELPGVRRRAATTARAVREARGESVTRSRPRTWTTCSRELLDSASGAADGPRRSSVLLHGVFKLGKRRKLISVNPSEDAERVTLEDAGA